MTENERGFMKDILERKGVSFIRMAHEHNIDYNDALTLMNLAYKKEYR